MIELSRTVGSPKNYTLDLVEAIGGACMSERDLAEAAARAVNVSY